MDWLGAVFLGQGLLDELTQAKKDRDNKRIAAYNSVVQGKEDAISSTMNQLNTMTSNSAVNSARNNDTKFKQDKINKLEREKMQYE